VESVRVRIPTPGSTIFTRRVRRELFDLNLVTLSLFRLAPGLVEDYEASRSLLSEWAPIALNRFQSSVTFREERFRPANFFSQSGILVRAELHRGFQ
jgi:hypothetical protein